MSPDDFWRSVPDGVHDLLIKCRQGRVVTKLVVTTVVVEGQCSAHYWKGITFAATEFNPEEYDDIQILKMASCNKWIDFL